MGLGLGLGLVLGWGWGREFCDWNLFFLKLGSFVTGNCFEFGWAGLGLKLTV